MQLLLQRQSVLRRVVADLKVCPPRPPHFILAEPFLPISNENLVLAGWSSPLLNHTYQVSQNRSSWVFSGSTCGVAKDVSLFWRRRWEREDDDGAGTEAWSVQPSGKEKHKSVCCSEKDKLLLCKLIKLNQLSKNTEAKVSKSYLH